MNKNPTVSVVMITFNHEKFIKEAILGVLVQDCDFDIEFIIANDKSTDSTDDVITKYLDQLTIPDNINIEYTNHQENKGMIPNFVWALKQARGKYIALCEGDDYWTDPLKLQKQVGFLEEHEDYVMCFHRCKTLSIINGNQVFKEQKLDAIDYYYSIENLLSYWNIPTASIVFRRQKETIPQDFLKVASGDIALAIYLFQFGKFYLFKEIMSIYRVGVGVSLQHKQFQMIDYRVDLYYRINKYYKSKYQKEIYTALFYVMQRYTSSLKCKSGIHDVTF